MKLSEFVERETRDKRALLLDFLIVGACILLVAKCYYLGEELIWQSRMSNSENSFYRHLEMYDYPPVVGMAYQNLAEEKSGYKNLSESYAVGKYYEAATMYRIHLEAGDTERAQHWKARMEEQVPELKDFALFQDDIDKRLGLQ